MIIFLYISWEKEYCGHEDNGKIINTKYCNDYIEYILKEVNKNISSGVFSLSIETVELRCERYLTLNLNIFNYKNIKSFSDTYKTIADSDEKN